MGERMGLNVILVPIGVDVLVIMNCTFPFLRWLLAIHVDPPCI